MYSYLRCLWEAPQLPQMTRKQRNRLTHVACTVFMFATSAVMCASCSNGSYQAPPGPPSVAVTLSPTSQSIAVGTNQTFTATVSNDSQSRGVTWTLSGAGCSGTSCGTLSATSSASGAPITYTAPAAVPSPATVILTATAVADTGRFSSATITITPLASSSVSVTTWHNDNLRSGVNSNETQLTPATINSTAKFGKKFSCTVDADVYAQPLYVPGVAIAGNGTHDVVFVATEKNSLYAFDANSNASPCVPLWQKSLMNSGETSVADSDVACSEAISPNIGITGTPVIDTTTSTLYVVTTSKTSSAFLQRLHAISLADGSEKPPGPVVIQASVVGTGAASSGGSVAFDPHWHLQRPGLLKVGTAIYIAWASYCDNDPYHGWILAYDAANLTQTAKLNVTPNGSPGRGGIWMAGAGPASDGTSIFLVTGNGDFDANSAFAPNNDYGDTFLGLTASLSVTDWFTPFNESTLDGNDLDLGGGGAVLLVDNPGGSIPHLLVGGGKEGKLYLLNRDNLGHFSSGSDSQIVQSLLVSANGIFASGAFWNKALFIAANSSPLNAFSFDTGSFPGKFNPTPTSSSSANFGFPGATPSVSSNGTSNGIVWAVQRISGTAPAVLHAYDATNLAVELWNSSQAAANRDQPGNAVKFAVPTIANGRVYIGTQSSLDAYGLLP